MPVIRIMIVVYGSKDITMPDEYIIADIYSTLILEVAS